MKESDTARLFGYLTHILQAIDRIQDYTDDLDEVAILQNAMAQDAVAHGYFKVDLAIVWQTLEKDLPELQAQTRAVIETERLEAESDSPD